MDTEAVVVSVSISVGEVGVNEESGCEADGGIFVAMNADGFSGSLRACFSGV